MLRLALIFSLVNLVQCNKDETVAAYGGGDRVWVLRELNGVAFTQTATLSFPEEGQITGEAPCNRYSGVMTVPYPWFDAGQVLSTRRACPDLEAEAAFRGADRSGVFRSGRRHPDPDQ